MCNITSKIPFASLWVIRQQLGSSNLRISTPSSHPFILRVSTKFTMFTRHIVLTSINASAYYQTVVHFLSVCTSFESERGNILLLLVFYISASVASAFHPFFASRFDAVSNWQSLHFSNIYLAVWSMAGVIIFRASYIAPHLRTSFPCAGLSLPAWFVLHILALIP
ncbi:hypothetical protein HHX47_DHR2000989 [Lentinula edodes]|nr:hypothetical protein HHX47_DHR2000989 [Lentinula edodes]